MDEKNIVTYEVIPLDERRGFIECVPDSETVHKIVNEIGMGTPPSSRRQLYTMHAPARTAHPAHLT